jgi:hypothetical protein
MQVLADYMALTGRELNLEEGEIVELIKIGCSGWWFVRSVYSVFGQLSPSFEKNKTIFYTNVISTLNSAFAAFCY